MDQDTLSRIRAVSMLTESALERLATCASEAPAGILEIGPYIGGSTLALAHGNQRKLPHAAIEVGGSHNHPTLPSKDIAADWAANLARFHVNNVLMCRGWSYQRSVREKALDHLGRKIGLFFLDADGNIAPAIRAFAPYMHSECIFAIDDYHAPDAQEKEDKIRPWIDAEVSAGRLTDGEVCGGTWFGRLTGSAARSHLTGAAPFVHETGMAFIAYFETPCPHDDVGDANTRSPLQLFEDGRALGPAHASHDDIRQTGKGRYSHWRAPLPGMTCLFFSSSDGANPNLNGRCYEVDLGDGVRLPLTRL